MVERYVQDVPGSGETAGYRRVVRIEIEFQVSSGWEICDFFIRGCYEPIGEFPVMPIITANSKCIESETSVDSIYHVAYCNLQYCILHTAIEQEVIRQMIKFHD